MSEYIVDFRSLAMLSRIVESESDRLEDPVVRCRDCDYYDHWVASGHYMEKHVCERWNFLEIEPDGFCAWGERKERIES